MPDQRIADLAREMMARQLATNPQQFDPKPGLDLGLGPGADPSTLSPEVLAAIGGLADAASTYAFLKRGAGVEANPLAGNGGPARTAAAAIAGMLLARQARQLLRRLSPGLADALAANQGAEQLGLSVENVAGHDRSSLDTYAGTMQRAGDQQRNRPR